MLSIGQQVGNYEILAEIGIGGMATVYRARHVVLESTHAVKVLLPHLLRTEGVLDRFVEEAKLQARFRHPSLVRVTDIISEPGVAGLVMDYLDGSTVENLILKRAISPGLAVRWAHQACGALGYIHSRGVVHRDIKPGNLLIEEVIGQGSQLMLMDFGIAKVHLKDRTRTAVAMGTPAYMSPEQITGARRVDARSDLFSLGVVLYEMLTGRHPFEADSDYAMQQAILAGDYVPLRVRRPQLSDHLESLIAQALMVRAAERFSHAKAMARPLSAAPEWSGTDPGMPIPART